MPPADAAGAAALGINAVSGSMPGVHLPIDAPRAVLIDTINTLIDLQNTKNERDYPVGTLYFNASVSTDPRQLLQVGIWERYGKGRVLVSLDEAQAAYDTIGETGNIVATAGAATTAQYIVVYVWRRIG